MAVKNPCAWATLHIHTGPGQPLGGPFLPLQLQSPTPPGLCARVVASEKISQSRTPKDLHYE